MQSISDHLKARRMAFGASVAQTAEWARLDPERLREIERGSPPTSGEYESLCRALAVDSGALARGLDRSPKRSVARFKAASWVSPTATDFRTLSLAAEIGRIGGFLARETDHQSPLATLRHPEPIRARLDLWKQGYQLGENAHRAFGLPPGPILDLEGVLMGWGIHVVRIEFSSEYLDAASLWESGALPIVLLNTRSTRSKSTLSRRALLAHELCHLLHDSGENDLTTQLSWTEGSGNYGEQVEIRARAFAPAFLAPRDDVRHWFRSGSGKRLSDPAAKVEHLARRWGFSLRGAIWHAKNCGIIKSRTAEELSATSVDHGHSWSQSFETESRQESAAHGTSARETSPLASGLMLKLVEDAVASGVISEGRGREIATWS